MGTARMVMTMAVVAIGAGAFLAVSTIPALGPYQQRNPERASPLVALPEPEDELPQTPSYGEAVPHERESAEDSFALGSQDGRLVLELPRWVEDGSAWVTLGRRTWQDWVEPEFEGDNGDEPRYGSSHDRRWEDRADDADHGYAERHGPGPDRPWRNDEEQTYGNSDRWSPAEGPSLPPAAPYAQPRQARPEFGLSRRQDEVPADAADRAAAGAREAARDARAAEGAVQ